jgi:hypothetical protein
MEEVDELIKLYGLEENPEFIIIPFTDKSGEFKKRYLLKRRFIRIVYEEGYFVDYPLADVIKATIKYPELLLSEALYHMYKESGRGGEHIDDSETCPKRHCEDSERDSQ